MFGASSKVKVWVHTAWAGVHHMLNVLDEVRVQDEAQLIW